MRALAKIFLMLFFLGSLYAQCPMCKQNLRSSDRSAIIAKGLRYGIFSLFFLPYVTAGIVAYLWYKRNKAIPKE